MKHERANVKALESMHFPGAERITSCSRPTIITTASAGNLITTYPWRVSTRPSYRESFMVEGEWKTLPTLEI
ncbi:uncharacterized protein CMC5_007150 [Chondromyces crocatus]|uniref:Uncharacterized protein n=1 Tax=Chondromyces crocatus TaxID=52 RepID=A0A0K1E7F3_CHOCO|nr:uncharacterized protein CMC5_007150 [Chondromyces crocatus]